MLECPCKALAKPFPSYDAQTSDNVTNKKIALLKRNRIDEMVMQKPFYQLLQISSLNAASLHKTANDRQRNNHKNQSITQKPIDESTTQKQIHNRFDFQPSPTLPPV